MDATPSIIELFARNVDAIAASAQPYDTDGARISFGLEEKRVQAFRDLIDRPAFTLADVVSTPSQLVQMALDILTFC